jgi:hypothetical protein
MKLYEIPSFSDKNITYKVVHNSTGKWTCNCMYQYSHPNEKCDHIRKAQHKKLKWHSRKSNAKVVERRSKKGRRR